MKRNRREIISILKKLKILIEIAGPIGIGKTTFAENLAKLLNADLYKESVENNPFLIPFYNDMKRWALTLQFKFSLSKIFDNYKMNFDKNNVCDKTLLEDREIFIERLKEDGCINDEEIKLYEEIMIPLLEKYKKPDFIIILTCDYETAQKRKNKRDRNFENNIDEYLIKLCKKYDEWNKEMSKLNNVIIVDWNKDMEDEYEIPTWVFETILKKIEEKELKIDYMNESLNKIVKERFNEKGMNIKGFSQEKIKKMFSEEEIEDFGI